MLNSEANAAILSMVGVGVIVRVGLGVSVNIGVIVFGNRVCVGITLKVGVTRLCELQATINIAANPTMRMISTTLMFSRNSRLENIYTPLSGNHSRTAPSGEGRLYGVAAPGRTRLGKAKKRAESWPSGAHFVNCLFRMAFLVFWNS